VNEEGGDAGVQEEPFYAVPMQQAAQVSQLMEQQTEPEVVQIAKSDRDPEDNPKPDSRAPDQQHRPP